MGTQKIPTVLTVSNIPNSLAAFRSHQSIEWSTNVAGTESDRKYFSAGRDTNWTRTKSFSAYADDIYGSNENNAFEISSDEKGENYAIHYLDLDVSRHFRGFTSMGFEWNQTGKDKGALYLINVGREYKKPGNNAKWSYSEQSLENTYKNDRGRFFRTWNFSSNEISQQTTSGYVLNRIYFHIGSSGSGSGGTGSAPETAVEIYNLKLGWGSGTVSTNHRICLPRIRSFSDAGKPQFGDD